MDMEKWSRQLKWLIPVGIVILICLAFPVQVALAIQLTLGGAAIGFLLRPLARKLERHMNPSVAALLSVALGALALVAVLAIFLPPMIMQVIDLIANLGYWIDMIKQMIAQASERMQSAGLAALEFPADALNFSAIADNMGGIVNGTAQMASAIAGNAMNAGLSAMLGVYFLLDWDNLLIKTELIIPSRARGLVLHMADEVGRGLRTYIRGQVTISVIVGTLTAIGLSLIGVKSALALGTIVGILNLVPYFGPILGGVPAVLTALSQDLIRALMTVAVLFVVQQIDGMLISPRVMSGVTGLSPAVVLIALSVGGSGWGIMGMLLALPVVLTIRICFRVWATRNEIIEKSPDV